MLDPAAVFHTGYVVDDLDRAMVQVAGAFAVSWTTVEQRGMGLRGPDGTFDVELRFVYAREGPHRIELLEAAPGTPWTTATAAEPVGRQAAHHVGVWTDDLVGESARLEEAGAPRVVTYDGPGGGVHGFAYHRLQDGMLVELVDARRRPAFERWFAGGPFPAAQER